MSIYIEFRFLSRNGRRIEVRHRNFLLCDGQASAAWEREIKKYVLLSSFETNRSLISLSPPSTVTERKQWIQIKQRVTTGWYDAQSRTLQSVCFSRGYIPYRESNMMLANAIHSLETESFNPFFVQKGQAPLAPPGRIDMKVAVRKIQPGLLSDHSIDRIEP